MRYIASLLAIAGLGLAIVLFARGDIAGIAGLLLTAGPGLLVASVFHVLPMFANARAWQLLMPESRRPGVWMLTRAIWVRESVNGLLPVARIGGEIVAYRMLRRYVTRRSEAAASLVADMGLSILSQAGFAIFGLSLLFSIAHSTVDTTRILAGVVGMLPLGAAFVLVQRAGTLGVLIRLLDRLFAGRLGFALTRSLRFDHALRNVYERHADVAACFAWQLVGWILGAGEIWLVLHFLGHRSSVLDSIVIEALIQAISSAAFIVPGAVGVQEGGFVLVCAALGIDATTALALATARRVRDVVVFFPGLLAWQWAEARK